MKRSWSWYRDLGGTVALPRFSSSSTTPDSIVLAACSFILCVAVTVLCGWLFDIESLRSVLPNSQSMKANTAVCFLLLTAATLIFRKETLKPAWMAAGFSLTAIVFLISTVTLSEYFYGTNLGVDEYLVRDLSLSSRPGRPAAIELVNFIFLTTAIFMLNWPSLRLYRTGQFLVFVVFISAMQGLIGFAIGLHSVFSGPPPVADYQQMAIHTTFTFILICIAILATRPDRGFIEAFGSASPSSLMARRMLIAIIVSPLLVRWMATAGLKFGFYDSDFAALIQLVGGMVVMGAILIWSATLLYHSERAREEARLKAESANRAKTNFLANISHELRTPLGAVLGFSELLANEKNNDVQKDDLTAAIRRNGDQLLRLIDDLLDISRIEAGNLNLDRRRLMLLDFLNDLGALAKQRCAERELSFEIVYRSALPETVLTDRNRLRQVLLNVIGNAIKFNARGGRVVLTVDFIPTTPPRLRFGVRDTGPGISNEAAAKLFQPFNQGDNSASRKFGGSGLGLALSRRIALALGGDLRLHESVIGSGSVFCLEVDPGPLEEIRLLDLNAVAGAQEPVREPQRSTAQKPQSDPLLHQVRILLVEDSADNRALVSRFLKSAGARVEMACDGLEGVQKALHGEFDIVLMDLQMPNLDGYDAIKRLRGIGYKVPIVALTAHAFKEDRDRCLQIGFNEHLTKPVNKNELIHTVEAFVH